MSPNFRLRVPATVERTASETGFQVTSRCLTATRGVNPGDLHRPAGHTRVKGRGKRLLEHELQRKLHLARSLRLKDMVERRRTDVTVRQPEIRPVQEVKQLRAELQLF